MWMKYDQQKDICSANLDLEATLHSTPPTVIANFSSKTMIRIIEDIKNFLHVRKKIISTKCV